MRRTVEDWRREVYRHPNLSNACKLLLVWLSSPDGKAGAERMRSNGTVSVARVRIAAALGVAERTVDDRLAEARRNGFLDVVVSGRKGRTAVYARKFPAPIATAPPRAEAARIATATPRAESTDSARSSSALSFPALPRAMEADTGRIATAPPRTPVVETNRDVGTLPAAVLGVDAYGVGKDDDADADDDESAGRRAEIIAALVEMTSRSPLTADDAHVLLRAWRLEVGLDDVRQVLADLADNGQAVEVGAGLYAAPEIVNTPGGAL